MTFKNCSKVHLNKGNYMCLYSIKNKPNQFALLCTITCSAIAYPTISQAEVLADISKAVKDSKVDVVARYRYEGVDQDGFDKSAKASTLKTRLSVTTAKFGKFSAKLEVDNVTEVGSDNYNSSANGQSNYPVVADMKGTDLNQSYITYHGDKSKFSYGRMRINHNDQRFLGGVGWRQNEQTYDGARMQFTPSDKLAIDASYIYNVNRIFTQSSAKEDNFHGNVIAVNAVYTLNKKHKLAAYGYNLDFENSASNSSTTIGLQYLGKFPLSNKNVLALKGAYASQSDTGENTNSYTASYYLVELMGKFKGFSFGGGYEVLGSDNGVGFKTPLATLHKFQGWADKFLGTPGNGVVDTYLKASTKLGKVKLTAVYHDLSADQGSMNYGTELDLVAAYKVNKQLSTVVKYAAYDADELATDTDKLWLMATFKF